ncbi:uncharacterized protein LOC133831030 [Humulus lupulus]|uniref:uncharacterized protein LOC133831030 n=1 Tax=Humulus lupulus TaxID=3486 RepID=UPI002B40A16E|nr:uncharacterized protein LOC133831030 [Humulus lupulus]
MATYNHYCSLIGAMDRLWFHQIILLSQPVSTPQSTSKSSSVEDEKVEDISSDFLHNSNSSNSSDSSNSLLPPKDDDEGDKEKIISKKKRPKRSRFVAGSRIMMIRSHSSSPSSTKNRQSCPSPTSTITRVLEKSMSCKSLGELELEELKGFMDLGFIFKKEHVSPRMVNLLPGLQRLEQVYKNKYSSSHKVEQVQAKEIDEEQEREQEEEEDQERGVIRPYLSEAWLIKRPSSPLLSLRVPRATAAADMKKHLKFWARTVASEIHQES